MSTRGQVRVLDCRVDHDIYLYKHNDAYDLPKIVQKALARKLKWDDPEYLTRIIFSEMIKDEVGDKHGYAIGNARHGDIDWLVTVDVANQTVVVRNMYENKPTFEEFVCNDIG